MFKKLLSLTLLFTASIAFVNAQNSNSWFQNVTRSVTPVTSFNNIHLNGQSNQAAQSQLSFNNGIKIGKHEVFSTNIDPGGDNGEICKQHTIDRAFQNDPAYKFARESADDMTSQIVSQIDAGLRGAPPVYTVPVVFHVIHKGEAVGTGTNISDAQLISSIDAMNRDYRRTAADGGIAQGAGPDTEIQFCLASVDPGGAPTTGINRVDGTSVANYASQGIISSNETAVKALSRWDNRYYVNVWIVSEIDNNGADLANPSGWGGGTLGYAYLPTNPVTFNSQRDGIVVVNLCIGNDPTQALGYRLWPWGSLLNRTMTHEMGHHLDLYHTFDGGSCTETNCNTQGDLVCDTPPTIQQTNCGTPACSGTQQVENYMDYTGEACNDMFSAGQTTRMRAALAGVRNELVTTSNCTPPNNWDAAISQINVPTGSFCSTTFDPEIILTNYGANTLTSVDIDYYTDANPATTYNWTGTLAASATTTITLPTMVETAGAHTFTATTVSGTLNGTNTDEDLSNDQLVSNFTVIASGNPITLTLDLDCYGSEITWEIVDATSTQVASGGPYTDVPGGEQQIIQTCLANGCYDFIIYDSYGDGMYGSQWGGCSIDGNYVITEDASAQVLVQMTATNADFGASATHNFCVPTTPVAPTADFVADFTTIPVGGTVNFTDLSTGSPAMTDWTWTITGPGPTIPASPILAVQNPAVQFNTIGLYTVSLDVDNGTGVDNETKVDYINVVSSSGLCDTLRNYAITEAITAFGITGQWGYYPAHNQLTMMEYAEPYTASGGTSIQAMLIPVLQNDDGGGSTFDINIYGDAAGQPTGAPLHTETVPYSQMQAGFYNYYQFATPYAVSGNFWVSISLTYNAGDTLVIGTADNRAPVGPSTTQVYWDPGTGFVWQDAASIFGNGLMSSMGIDILLSSGGPTASFTQSASTICEGATLNLDGTGSTGTTDYFWDLTGGTPATSIASTEAPSYATAGVYDVKLYVQGGCLVDSLINTVTVNAGPTHTSSSTDENCGSNDGTITITSGTGTQYSIDNGVTFQGTGNFTGLGPGTYDIVVEDAIGCSSTSQITVNSAGGPTITASTGTDPLCNATCDGSITITHTGGTQFSIDNGVTFQGSNIFTNLCPGTYDIVVQDGGGCQSIDQVTITDPTLLSHTETVTDATCGNTDGIIDITATGGTGGLQYSIDNGVTFQGSNIFNGLAPGTYDVIVEDANGCQSTAQVTVTTTSGPTISASTGTPPLCNGGCDGTIVITQTGGTQYSIDNGVTFQASNTFTNLCAGTYDIVVEDGSGCQAIDQVTITDPAAIVVNATGTDENCNGADGTITINATSGTPPFQYSIDGGVTFQAGSTFNGLIAGTYNIVVEDANGCQETQVINISNTGGITGSVSNDQTICAGASVTLSAGGGTTYSWDDGVGVIGTNPTVSVTPTVTTTYTVTVGDGTGCTDVLTVTITVNPIPVTTVSSDTTICAGDSITLVGAGGASYFWNTGATTSSITVAPSSQTTYTVIASNGPCVGSQAQVTVTVDPAPTAVAGSDVTTTYLTQGGTVNFNTTGSLGATFDWDFGDSNTGSGQNVTHNYSSVGTYTVVLTVTLGNCTATDTIIIIVEATNSISEISLENAVSLYPNPTNGTFYLEIDMLKAKDLNIAIYNVLGEIVTQFAEKKVKTQRFTLQLDDHSNGFYFINIRSENESVTKRISLIR
jgi:PKD repeat protein